MTIEEELWKRAKIDWNKILKYGFKKENSLYKYSKNIMDDTFRIDIEISKEGIVKGKIIDLSFGEEYTNFLVEGNMGSFANQVKEEYENVLKDIRNNCSMRKDFIYEQSNRIAKEIKEKYGDDPQFEWEKFPGYATFRNKDSKKWYGIIMNIDKNKLEKKSNGEVEIIDIKLEPNEIEELLNLDGFYSAYHMNKKNWITIILNDTISDEKILKLIEKSYSYTEIKKNKAKNEWIIPANPKYFDIEKALEQNHTIMWKQSTEMKINDIVYIYVGNPYSSMMYKCRVIEVNIPFEDKKEKIKMKKVMKMELTKKYEKGKLTRNKLKEFGIKAIRGPRYMPLALSEYINRTEK